MPFDRLPCHALRLLEDAHRETGPERRLVVDQSSESEEGERVTHVDRQRDAVESVQRRPAAPHVAVVLDVVVHEERIVEELERHRRAHRVFQLCAEGPCGGDAKARAQHAAAASRVVGNEVVEVTMRRPGPEIVAERHPGDVPVFAEERRDEVRRHPAHGPGVMRTLTVPTVRLVRSSRITPV